MVLAEDVAPQPEVEDCSDDAIERIVLGRVNCLCETNAIETTYSGGSAYLASGTHLAFSHEQLHHFNLALLLGGCRPPTPRLILGAAAPPGARFIPGGLRPPITRSTKHIQYRPKANYGHFPFHESTNKK